MLLNKHTQQPLAINLSHQKRTLVKAIIRYVAYYALDANVLASEAVSTHSKLKDAFMLQVL